VREADVKTIHDSFAHVPQPDKDKALDAFVRLYPKFAGANFEVMIEVLYGTEPLQIRRWLRTETLTRLVNLADELGARESDEEVI
jgi:hypothetical protein